MFSLLALPDPRSFVALATRATTSIVSVPISAVSWVGSEVMEPRRIDGLPQFEPNTAYALSTRW